MPKRLDPSVVAGILLLVAGILYFLQMQGLLAQAGRLFWGGVFLLAGTLFLTVGAWWAILPAMALIGIGAIVWIPDSLDDYKGAIFLGSLALGFWIVYAGLPQGRWWALIPAGVLTSMAILVLLPDSLPGESLFLLGMALTFALVALLAGMRWAWYPAGILAAISLMVFLHWTEWFTYVAAILLIAGGGILLYRAVRRA